MRRQFAVIGLGYFGRTVAHELTRLGHDVLAIDIQDKVVNSIADQFTHAVIADATDERALRELNIAQYDAVLVAIGENIEASILCTMQLKTLGVKEIWVKALTAQHHKILVRLGATRIVHPEHEMGMRIAQALNYPMVSHYINLGHDYFVVEVIASSKLESMRLNKLLGESGSDVALVAIKRGEQLRLNADPDFMLASQDRIILIGRLSELLKLTPLL